jgi:RNA polymerase sigma-70 factor (ECF subfamily)
MVFPGSRDELSLRRAARGDRRHLERFYEAHVDDLYAYLFYRVGRDATLAEEAVQETFARALQRLSSYDASRGSVRAWLRSLSRNVVRDLIKSHRRTRDLIDIWDRIDESLAQVFAALDRAPLPPELFGREETRELVSMAVANLPEKYRQVLVQKYVDGESVASLSQQMSLSEDAVKSLLARARRAFKETFAALGNELGRVPA